MPSKPSIAPIIAALTELHQDLVAAQQQPMPPELRRELGKIAGAAQRNLTGLEMSQATAADQLAANQQKVAAMAQANRQRIAASQQKLTRPEDNPIPAVPIDPTLGRLLSAELLARQSTPPLECSGDGAGGVLDDWQWNAPAATCAAAQ